VALLPNGELFGCENRDFGKWRSSGRAMATAPCRRVAMAPGIRHKNRVPVSTSDTLSMASVIEPGQFDFARSALRNVRRKALGSVAGSCSCPVLTPYNDRSKARTVVADARAVSA